MVHIGRNRRDSPRPGPHPPRADGEVRVAAVGHIWGDSGYATAFRSILIELERQGITIASLASPAPFMRRAPFPDDARADIERWQGRTLPADVTLSFVHPVGLTRGHTKHHVAIAEFESPELPSWAVKRLNQVDEVWNPSSWGTERFRAAGVSVPVLWMLRI